MSLLAPPPGQDGPDSGSSSWRWWRPRQSKPPPHRWSLPAPTVRRGPHGHSSDAPQTRHVRGSNLNLIGVTADRQPGRTIIVSVLDNLVKGASGQAVQCANIVLGLVELEFQVRLAARGLLEAAMGEPFR